MAWIAAADVALQTGSSETARIDALIPLVCDAIEAWCGRKFSRATETERHAGGGSTIALSRYPVASVTSVTYLPSSTALTASDYSIEADTGLLRRLPWGAVWEGFGTMRPRAYGDPWGAENAARQPVWQVVYVGGPEDAPMAAKLAAIDTVAALIKAGMGGFTSEKDGDYAYSRAAVASAIPASAKGLLAPWRAAPL